MNVVYSFEEAAQLLGITMVALTKALLDNRINFTVINKKKVITQSEIDRFNKEKNKHG